MATREGRNAVLKEWVVAAGGTVDPEGKVRLPSDLRGCLALAELKALARALGSPPDADNTRQALSASGGAVSSLEGTS
jgi:hypothetical protein